MEIKFILAQQCPELWRICGCHSFLLAYFQALSINSLTLSVLRLGRRSLRVDLGLKSKAPVAHHSAKVAANFCSISFGK